MAIEQPRYTVALKDGDFELRRYEPYVVAEVVASGDQGQAVQQGFRKLAGYIFGGNAGQSKIAMTSPVVQTPEGPERWTVRFMMPSDYTLQTLPAPRNGDIHFLAEPGRERAVLHFSGVAREGDYRRRTDELRRWIAARGLTSRGEATLAQYDPPWTLWFMRRNEVWLDIER